MAAEADGVYLVPDRATGECRVTAPSDHRIVYTLAVTRGEQSGRYWVRVSADDSTGDVYLSSWRAAQTDGDHGTARDGG